MSLPALRAVRQAYPSAHIAVLARPWVADVYARESSLNAVIPYTARPGWRDLPRKWKDARAVSGFDAAILLQNAFEAAALAWLARAPVRIGYRRDARGWLLTDAVPVPRPGEIPRHECYYYLELLRRAGIIDSLPRVDEIRLEGSGRAAEEGVRRFGALGIEGDVIGVSPGAAYGSAKQWLSERFAETALALARAHGARVALFGSADERALCQGIGARIPESVNLAGQTTLREFIELAAACRLFLTNDSGAMHLAAALGVPSVTVFGSTDPAATGPAGGHAVIVREPVECSPCLLRECPIDHRCMTRVTVERVTEAALALWERTAQRGHQNQNPGA